MNITTEPLPNTGFRCPLCGEPLRADAAECTKCDWVKGYGETERPKPVNPHDILAAALSLLLPGAGHYFKGHRTVALLLCLIGVPVVGTFAFAFTMFFGWLLVPVYWIAVATDAYLRKDLRPAILPAGRKNS